MSRKYTPLFLSAAAIAFSLTIPAEAAVEEGTLSITATVIAQCTISTSPIGFGQISPTQAASATGSITISCDDNNTIASVTLDGGNNATGGTRQMADGSAHNIPYTLQVGGSPIAVDGDIASQFTLTGTGPYTDSVDVDGTIAAVAAPGRNTGSYDDSVTITVTYSAP